MIKLNVASHEVLRKPEAIALQLAINTQVLYSGKCHIYTEDGINYDLAISDDFKNSQSYSHKDQITEIAFLTCFCLAYRQGYAQSCTYHELNMPTHL